MNETLAYVETKLGVSQYADVDFSTGNPVEARYVHAFNSADRGNILIEALPSERMGDALFDEYCVDIPDYDATRVLSMNTVEALAQVNNLYNVRFPLPYQKNLEMLFHSMLCRSYSTRQLKQFSDVKTDITVHGQQIQSDSVLEGKVISAAVPGISLSGFSGCGKSSSVEILQSRYPQVIIHQTPSFCRFVQLVYVAVECTQHSNMSALYIRIGEAIDKALGNGLDTYKTLITKKRTLGEKADAVCELIEKFAIGALIIDEIQFINFKTVKEESFESLLSVVNRTHVGILTIGTQKANASMYANVRMARRAGPNIDAGRYCSDRSFFDTILAQVWQYQWIVPRVELTQEISDMLYYLSSGRLFFLFDIFVKAQQEYLLAEDKKPKVDAKYFKRIAKNLYGSVVTLMKGTEETGANDLDEEELSALADARVAALRQEETRHQEAIISAMNNPDLGNQRRLRENIRHNIDNAANLNGMAFDDIIVEAAMKSVLYDEANLSKTEDELTKLVFDEVKRRASKPGRKPKKGVGTIALKNILPSSIPALETPANEKPSDD